ncbi:MAG: hypothetical protein JRD68_05970 [Deltaproteobacteria bacterium]|nr:hypothetical protein [Deltaproteobacteria bacterium]
MAASFKILCHQTESSLHLKLLGDFDDTSVYELMEFLKKHHGWPHGTFIHTDGLNRVNPMAGTTLLAQLHVSRIQTDRLAFTGGHAAQIAPFGNNLALDQPMNNYNEAQRNG